MKITRLAALTPEIIQALGVAIRSGAAQLAQLIEIGQCQLYRVNDDSYLVTEIVHCFNEPKTLILHCYAGRGVDEILRLMERVARKNGFGALEVRTHRKGIRRILGKHDYAEEIRVFRKVLK